MATSDPTIYLSGVVKSSYKFLQNPDDPHGSMILQFLGQLRVGPDGRHAGASTQNRSRYERSLNLACSSSCVCVTDLSVSEGRFSNFFRKLSGSAKTSKTL